MTRLLLVVAVALVAVIACAGTAAGTRRGSTIPQQQHCQLQHPHQPLHQPP
uniref:Uncharacterized protein n=1 Tax=Candidatus Methanogaster sp. ANME-2c ERB4 TaxID=2759911 RepID=A0A7G9YRR5_9EURY|nr:hypothetical protein HLBKPKBF_00017 [Methanosarcinales archaeon ANME-2c ERB4]